MMKISKTLTSKNMSENTSENTKFIFEPGYSSGSDYSYSDYSDYSSDEE